MQNTKAFKLVLVGESGSGKTSYLNNLFGKNTLEYKPTSGYNIQNLFYKTNNPDNENIIFNVWDIGGKVPFLQNSEEYSSECLNCLKNADCAIIMFDTRKPHYSVRIEYWYNKIKEYNLCRDLPIIAVSHATSTTQIEVNNYEKIDVYSIQNNLMTPLEKLVNILTNNNELKLSSYLIQELNLKEVEDKIPKTDSKEIIKETPKTDSKETVKEKNIFKTKSSDMQKDILPEKLNKITTLNRKDKNNILLLMTVEKTKQLVEKEKTLQEKEKTKQLEEKTKQIIELTNLLSLVLGFVPKN